MIADYKEQFPYMEPLSVSFYKEQPYKSNPYRRSKALIIMCAMRNYEKFRDLEKHVQDDIVKSVERCCVVSAKELSKEENVQCGWENTLFQMRYSNIVYTIASNLDFTNNTYLIPLILDKKIKPENLVKLTEEEMNPERNRKYIDRSIARKNAEIEIKLSSLYQCEKCGRSECRVVSVQLRGADEGRDDNILCNFCGHGWIIRN